MKDKSLEFVQPLKSAIKKMLRDKIKNADGREEFASFLKKYSLPHSNSHIEKLLYQEDYGGLEAIIFSLYFSLGIKKPLTKENLESILIGLQSEYTTNEADKIWHSMPLEKRTYFAKVLKAMDKI